jgi:hypothetical protein
MLKKIIFLFLVVILLAGGLFYYWRSQENVRALNKTLPKGVRVEKSLFGNSYKVVNKIDGYEFEVPKAWKGVQKIEYIPSTPGEKYSINSINLRGVAGVTNLVAVDKVNTEQNPEIRKWAGNIFNEYGFTGEFLSDRVGDEDVVKTQENIHLAGMYVYFFSKDASIYIITNGSEEFIKEIILSGKW